MDIYVGNLAQQVTDDDLKVRFGAFGQVASARVIKDRVSGASRGFGFVTMPNNSEGQAAINGLRGKDLKDRELTVNQARGREGINDRWGRGGPHR
jgi:RNA recognition motif-containing protein